MAARPREAGCRDDVEELAELARLSTHLPDGRVEVCAGARRLLNADTVVEFEAIGAELESTEVAGLPLRRNAFVDVDDPVSIVAAAFRDGDRVFRSDRDDPTTHEFSPSRAVLASPVMRGMDRTGVMVWLWRRPRGPLSRYEHALVDLLVAEKGLTVERHHLLRLGDDRLGRERAGRSRRAALDALAAQVAAVRATVEQAVAARAAHADPEPDDFERLAADLPERLRRIDELVVVLRPPSPLCDLGFEDALAALVDDARRRFADADVALVADPAGASVLDIRPSVAEAVLFVVAQALDRAAGHSGAHRVRVHASVDDNRLTVSVEADAPRLSRSVPGRFDEVEMRERARLVGADLRVDSTRGGGATVAVRVDRPTSSALLRE